MDAIEFIGFLIMMFAFVFMAVQQARRQAQVRGNDDEEQEQQQHAYEELYAAEEEEGTHSPAKARPRKKPSTRRTLTANYALQSNIEKRPPPSTSGSWTFESSLEHRYDEPRKPLVSQELLGTAYIRTKVKGVSRAQQLLRGGGIRDAIILHEILSKPRAVEPYDDIW